MTGPCAASGFLPPSCAASRPQLTQAAAAGAGGEPDACGPLRPGIVLAASASRMDSENATAQRQIAAAARKAARYAVRVATWCPATRWTGPTSTMAVVSTDTPTDPPSC